MYVLMGVSLIIIVAFYLGGTDTVTFANGKEYSYPNFTDNMMMWTYGLFIVSVASAVLFPIYTMITDFQKAKRSLLGVLALAVVVGIGYTLASSAIPTFHNVEKFNITESISKNVGTGLFVTYLLGGIAILGILYTEISKSFK